MNIREIVVIAPSRLSWTPKPPPPEIDVPRAGRSSLDSMYSAFASPFQEVQLSGNEGKVPEQFLSPKLNGDEEEIMRGRW